MTVLLGRARNPLRGAHDGSGLGRRLAILVAAAAPIVALSMSTGSASAAAGHPAAGATRPAALAAAPRGPPDRRVRSRRAGGGRAERGTRPAVRLVNGIQ